MVDVYRRPGSPYWYFDLTVEGERKRRSTKRTKKSEAEAVARVELGKALDKAQFGEVPELTLREALFDHYLPTRINRASYKNLVQMCHALCGDREGVEGIGRGGSMPFHEVTKNMLNAYRAKRLAAGRAEQTVDHELKCIRTAYLMLESDFRVRPGLKVPMARPVGIPRYLMPDEEAALLADLDPNRPFKARGGGCYQIDPFARAAKERVDNYDLVIALLDTGCRFGEIAKLTWSMVDTREWRTINIFRKKVKNEGDFALTARLAAVLKRRYETRGNSHYVFPGYLDKGEDGPRSTTRAIRRAMARVGINDPEKVARFGRRDVRSLRDTFASKLRKGNKALGIPGMPLDRLQKLLGHTTPQMTQKYADLGVDQASDEAVAALNLMNQ
jgi:integrase